MTDPSYLSQWPGLGRVTNLTIANRVQLWVCSSCAGIVIDTDHHTRWHRTVRTPNGRNS